MVDITISGVLEPDTSDPLSGKRYTTAVIVDGAETHCLRVPSRDPEEASEATGWCRLMKGFASALIAEAYRIGKESR